MQLISELSVENAFTYRRIMGKNSDKTLSTWWILEKKTVSRSANDYYIYDFLGVNKRNACSLLDVDRWIRNKEKKQKGNENYDSIMPKSLMFSSPTTSERLRMPPSVHQGHHHHPSSSWLTAREECLIADSIHHP